MNPAAVPAPSAAAARLAWLDVAKGACILLVVLHHVVTKYLADAIPVELGGIAEVWTGITMFLKPLRMPMFFVISGFFAAGAIHRPWGSVARRFTSPYYLYVVWLAVYFVVYRIDTTTDANRTEDLHDAVTELIWAETSMWFLYALAVYFVIAKLLRPLPPGLVVAAATALALWSGWAGIDENNKLSVLSHLCFFVVGAYFPELVRRAGELSPRALRLLGVGYLAAFVGLQVTGLPWSITLVGAGCLGIPLALGTMAHVARSPLAGRGLVWLGQRTLRIYVLHFLVIAVLFHLPPVVTGTGFFDVLLAALLPVLATAVVTVLCLFVYELMVVHGGQHLFAMHPVLDAAHDSWVVAGPRQPSSRRRNVAPALPE